MPEPLLVLLALVLLPWFCCRELRSPEHGNPAGAYRRASESARRGPSNRRRQLVTVDRLPQRDIRRNERHLVALQPADEMPPRDDALVRETARLARELLGAVLADVGRAGVQRFAHGADGNRLRD